MLLAGVFTDASEPGLNANAAADARSTGRVIPVLGGLRRYRF
jgi:hypothetical protein